MQTRWSARLAVVAAVQVMLVGSGPARAQSSIAAAAKAFALGQQAELAGNFRTAAAHYELADQTVPSPEALRSAARTRLRAGDEAMAATHAEQLARRYADPRSRQLASEILAALRPKLTRVALTCRPSCAVVVDGGALGLDKAGIHVFYVEPGQHVIGGGDAAPRVVQAEAGASLTLALVAPPAPPPAVAAPRPQGSPAPPVAVARSRGAGEGAPPRSGLHVGWFIASGVVTVGLGSAALWSGLDVLDRKEAFDSDPTVEALEDGRSRQRRTNYLMGATAAAAVATGLIAWWTDWSPGEGEAARTTVGIAPAAGGAVIVLGGGIP